MQETRVQFLGGEDPLEKEMATHSSILAWRISWTQEPGGIQSVGLQRVGKNLPAVQETWVRSLGWEDPLEESMVTPPVFLPHAPTQWSIISQPSILGH